MRGSPSSPDPTTTTLEFGDSASFSVASIPLSLKIFDVSELFKILFAFALPSASILNFSASCLAFLNETHTLALLVPELIFSQLRL